MNFLKTSLLSGLSTLIKLLSGLVVNKVVAVYIGPAGVALIGQFQNFMGIITTLGNGAINSGVTKYVAEYHETNVKKRNDFISASLIISVISSIIIGIIVFFGSSFLSGWILNTREYSLIFKIFGITLILISFNTILLSIINGMKRIKLFIAINISSSLLSLIITCALTIGFKVLGALLSMVVIQSLIFFVTLPIVIKKIKIEYKFNIFIEKEIYNKLFAFSLMTIISVLSLSITQISIRNYLINEFSIEQAGYWQSIMMISSMYLLILTTALSTYYLPKLSELQSLEDLKTEILAGYKIILPFVFVTASIIYLLKNVIINILFTVEFSAMSTLFLFQLIGDFFKMASWTLAFLMVAKAMTRTFIVTEIIFSITFYVLMLFFTRKFGLEGVTHAYALNYFLYLITMLVLFRKIVFFSPKKKNKIIM